MTSSLARRVLCRQARPSCPSCLSSTAPDSTFCCSSPASRIQRPAFVGVHSPPSTARTHPRNRHRAPAVSRQTDIQFELVVVVSQHAPHRTPHRPPTSVQHQHQQPAARTSIGHPSRTITLPFHPSTRLHPSSSLGRASVFKSTLPRTHLPSFINPTLRTHHHSSSPVHCYPAFGASPPTRHSSQHLRAALTHAPAVHCSRTFAPSCARLTLAAPPRLPFCVARASPSRQ